MKDIKGKKRKSVDLSSAAFQTKDHFAEYLMNAAISMREEADCDPGELVGPLGVILSEVGLTYVALGMVLNCDEGEKKATMALRSMIARDETCYGAAVILDGLVYSMKTDNFDPVKDDIPKDFIPSNRDDAMDALMVHVEFVGCSPSLHISETETIDGKRRYKKFRKAPDKPGHQTSVLGSFGRLMPDDRCGKAGLA